MKRRIRSISQRFTRADERRLRRALAKVEEAHVYRRLEALLFLAQTGSVSEAARRTRTTRFCVHRWAQWYLLHRDPSALSDQARVGRPRLGQKLQGHVWREVLGSDPKSFGYRAYAWTTPLLALHLQTRLGIVLSARTVRRRLRETDFRFKRPRHRFSLRAEPIGPIKGGSFAA